MKVHFDTVGWLIEGARDSIKRRMDKIDFTGTIVSIKARIRLIRSFDQIPTHQYQGYTLIVDGQVDRVPRSRFKIAIGPKAMSDTSFKSVTQSRGTLSLFRIPKQNGRSSIGSVGYNSSSGLSLMRCHPVPPAASRHPSNNTVDRGTFG